MSAAAAALQNRISYATDQTLHVGCRLVLKLAQDLDDVIDRIRQVST